MNAKFDGLTLEIEHALAHIQVGNDYKPIAQPK